MATPENNIVLALELAQLLYKQLEGTLIFDNVQEQIFNQAIKGQVESLSKRYRAMPLSGRWPMTSGLWFERKAEYGYRKDGSLGGEGDPIIGYTNRLTGLAGDRLSLEIEQREQIDGTPNLRFVEITDSSSSFVFVPTIIKGY